MKEKITVLIADDNPDFAMTLVSYLEKEEDMEVIGIAKDGKEACDMIINTEPDVVLLDVITNMIYKRRQKWIYYGLHFTSNFQTEEK